MLITTTALVTLTHINCGECGGTYAINEKFRSECEVEGRCWTCPYCKCGWGYDGQGENARLKRDLKQRQESLALERARHDQTKAALEHTESRRRAAVGVTTRIRNRIEKGVCHKCNRSFENLRRHMETQHKEVAG